MEKSFYEEMIEQRKAKADAQAKEYFYNKKQRKAYYWAEGSTYYDSDNHNEVFLPFTDEEIARIKQLIIDTVNDDQPDATPVSNVEEALECFSYSELFEMSEELRNLLFDRCEQANLDPSNIDFDTRYYFYRFGCIAYDYEKNKVCEPITVEILLSDEDYLTLLSLQLQDREYFTFNKLLKTNHELAIKLNNAVEGRHGAPFTILFEEIREDAEAIDGPMPAYEEIFSEVTDEYLFHILTNAASHVLTITEEKMKQDALFADQRILYDIDADKVMEFFDAKDYKEMLNHLKCNFHEREAFDSIKSWLRNSEISFREKASE